MVDKIDRKLLSLLQEDSTLSLQSLADAVNLTSTPCWKRLKKLEDNGIIRGRVTLLDGDKLGSGLIAFMFIKTQQHNKQWYQDFVSLIHELPEVMGCYRMSGQYDYLLRIQIADMKSYDALYKKLVEGISGLTEVTSSFAMEEIKYTTAIPLNL
ncbi:MULTISPECIES: Lrp/AsnC family transcriptional regulator [Tatumella]|uniref:Lrp/AsnC family transcriptional regulator n=1 Tax=Tatumella punctata TaxID=399969 RepID=A0ABW1VQT5_9GAMM|nr:MULTISPECIES: Lrp/AsnC family transcriptional regulator [unclassified Tatumella]MBS0854489.1 Lrp/AsnC family transcriptional regulator [Tatumella sp. JGM16]MBS0875778.1 Lrp/AsnC family transcriptional regulator [Tatumella sp. JGM82]MBS0890183.1 Lrp/AsnC family transcriptional regulator [Tatumella sp. JGM94]MBS0893763.1 Lrp/AsnC family transcriptional regulator [Tatumella sp. JGM130]MBS0900309.1 Lrp/AsnC family transcriptional regulator [Tatumella sp. JGM100]